MASPSAPKGKLGTEIKVTHEDQKMINSFANTNSKHNDVKIFIANKKKELQNLEDASDEMMLLDDESVPVHIGEVFFQMTTDEVQEFIDDNKQSVVDEIKKLTEKSDVYRHELDELKVKLYAKLGTSINLEEDE